MLVASVSRPVLHETLCQNPDGGRYLDLSDDPMMSVSPVPRRLGGRGPSVTFFSAGAEIL